MNAKIRFLEYAFIATIFLTPLFFGSVHYRTAMALAAWYFFLLFCYPEALQKIHELPRLFLFGIAAVFLGILIQYFFTSGFRAGTGYQLLLWLAAAAGFVLLQLLPQDSLVRLGKAIILMGILESIYGYFQVISGHESVLWHKKELHLGFATGTFLNRNHLAGFLELVLGIQLGAWVAAFVKKDAKSIFILAILLTITATGFFKTGSRMGVISFGIACLVFIFFLVHKSKKIAAVFLGCFVLIATVGFFAGGEGLLQRWQEFNENLPPFESRFLVWQDTLRMIRDFPLFGVGLGNFEWRFPFYQSETLSLDWNHAHNDYLELAAELGLPVFVLLVFAFAALSADCFRKWWKQKDLVFAWGWGGSLALTSLAIHSFFDFNLAIPANRLLFIYIFAGTVRVMQYHDHEISS